MQLQAQHVEEARLDAELLLAAAAGMSRASLLAHLDDAVSDDIAVRFAALIERRARHEPVAYILGSKEFYGLDLLVDARVLIPRPETELLVEKALQWLNVRRSDEGYSILDIGTGSGAIALALASNYQLPITMIASDVSADALAVAQHNATRLALYDKIRFVQSDLFTTVEGAFDLIVANLPYIARDEWDNLAHDIAAYEPPLALDGGDDGLAVFRRFFAQAPGHLAPHGAIMLEIGWKQAQDVSALAKAAFAKAEVEALKDGAGLDRIVVVQT
jgi:release factor glutamine methyltransferase